MRQNTNGRGELLNFLKGETHKGIDWTKEVDVTKSTQSHQLKGSKSLAVQQVSYELSGLAGKTISDPMVLEEGNRKYIFKNVIRASNDEAVLKTLEIEQL